jgi:hypothetical protein
MEQLYEVSKFNIPIRDESSGNKILGKRTSKQRESQDSYRDSSDLKRKSNQSSKRRSTFIEDEESEESPKKIPAPKKPDIKKSKKKKIIKNHKDVADYFRKN